MSDLKLNRLKPCPFCGHDVIYGCIYETPEKNKICTIWITCQNCNMETRKYYDKKGLFELWNNRTLEMKNVDIEECLIYGYTYKELKQIINFAKSKGYNPKENINA